MKKFAFQSIGLVILALGAMAIAFNPTLLDKLGIIPANQTTTNASPNPTTQKVITITSVDSSATKAQIKVEIANTDALRSKGLGYRQSLLEDSGMLFIFDQPRIPGFWMKGMQFPLDFIWINNGLVVDLLANIPPPTQGQSDTALPIYSPVTKVNQVLEVNAGFIAAHNIKVGDVLSSN